MVIRSKSHPFPRALSKGTLAIRSDPSHSNHDALDLLSTALPGPMLPGTIGAGETPGTATGIAAPETPLLVLPYADRSSHLPKIIFPAVVCNTDVTDTSMVLPIIFRALSTTTMVPSSR